MMPVKMLATRLWNGCFVPAECPRCRTRLPAVGRPDRLYAQFWYGSTCATCHARLDVRGLLDAEHARGQWRLRAALVALGVLVIAQGGFTIVSLLRGHQPSGMAIIPLMLILQMPVIVWFVARLKRLGFLVLAGGCVGAFVAGLLSVAAGW